MRSIRREALLPGARSPAAPPHPSPLPVGERRLLGTPHAAPAEPSPLPEGERSTAKRAGEGAEPVR
ncbi:MAG: hypothetical protein B7X67_24085 [Rhizobiales bacterium 39-66-18]|nr:MAG: hypothetical protein B7X67_24085 [Rhizobiales bacterium 39-66-18]